MIQLKKGDIFFTKGSSFTSKLVRYFSNTVDVNHVGLVISDGTIKNAIVIEALARVRKHTLWHHYVNRDDQIAIYRPLNLTDKQLEFIVKKAKSLVNKKYGYLKIIAHFMDWCIGGRYFFRRFANLRDYPICSWLVAAAYATVGKTFGVETNQAQPDDIFNFVKNNSDKYEFILPLDTIANHYALRS